MKISEEEYVDRYVLSKEEYRSVWRPIQEKIFRVTEDPKNPITPTAQVFKSGFQFRFRGGGGRYMEPELKMLKGFLADIGEGTFVMVENPGATGLSKFRNFRFPADITWDQYSSGGEEALPLLITMNRHFYVFGESDRWGIYISEGLNLDIVGLKGEAVVDAFQENFSVDEDKSMDAVIYEFAHLPGDMSAKYTKSRLTLFGQFASNYLAPGHS